MNATFTFSCQAPQAPQASSQAMSYDMTPEQLEQAYAYVQSYMKSLKLRPTAQVLVVPKSQHSLVPRRDLFCPNITYEKQWKVCDPTVVKLFKNIVCTQFFNGDEARTNEFLACFTKYGGAAISGGTVLAAYQGWLDQTISIPFVVNDLDVFYCANGNPKTVASIRDQLQAANFSKSLLAKNYELQQYTTLETVRKVDNYVSNKGKIIQLIESNEPAVRTHIRGFDLSCCQMFFMNDNIYMRELYADLTAHKYMMLTWNHDLSTTEKYANRVRKYMSRGWTPVSTHAIHWEKAPADIKAALVMVTEETLKAPTPAPVVFNIVRPENSIKEVGALIQRAREIQCTGTLYPTVFNAIRAWISAVSIWKDDTQISNVYKRPLSDQLVQICQLVDRFAGVPEGIQGLFVEMLFTAKDRRWILMLFADMKYKWLQNCFTDQVIAQAKQQQFARDHVYLMKSIQAQAQA